MLKNIKIFLENFRNNLLDIDKNSKFYNTYSFRREEV